jgi:hypothetical protein
VKKSVAALAIGLTLFGAAGCKHNSDVVSKNLSNDADNYRVFRQIVVYNALQDKYVLEVDGFCSLGNSDTGGEVTYTCKSPGGYVKDIIERSDNTFVFVHQLHPKKVSQDYFKVTLKPTTIIPDFDLQ